MRLTKAECNIISGLAVKCFGFGTTVLLFWSRVYDDRKGGDIDLLVEGRRNRAEDFQRKIHFLSEERHVNHSLQ